ncbi:MAG TPA: hypothetical protein VHP83_01685, partial [Aggregatilineaceae bacterium]|nr:hypothetical protein [Aggregatilineaceae bacterium]
MGSNLDVRLARWLEEIREKAPGAIEREIENRVGPYPQLKEILQTSPIDLEAMRGIMSSCTVMTDIGRYSSGAFKQLLDKDVAARHLITRLIRLAPNQPAQEIDDFVNQAHLRCDLSLASLTLIASLILTSVYPADFVDYPAAIRWTNFARYLEQGRPKDGATHGVCIEWANGLA